MSIVIVHVLLQARDIAAKVSLDDVKEFGTSALESILITNRNIKYLFFAFVISFVLRIWNLYTGIDSNCKSKYKTSLICFRYFISFQNLRLQHRNRLKLQSKFKRFIFMLSLFRLFSEFGPQNWNRV